MKKTHCLLLFVWVIVFASSCETVKEYQKNKLNDDKEDTNANHFLD